MNNQKHNATRCVCALVTACVLSSFLLSCGGGGGGGGGIAGLFGGNTVSTVDPRFVEVKGLGSTFYMSVNEVTKGEYWNVTGKNPTTSAPGIAPTDPNVAVYLVSWRDAVIYCNLRSSAEGLEPCYRVGQSANPSQWGSYDTSSITCVSGNGYRLPTQAEWQYAAGGGDKPEGFTYAGSNAPSEVAWYGNDKTHEVKTKKPNSLGIYDMSGNVWEWTNDKNICGGSVTTGADKCEIKSVESYPQNDNATSIGFRVVRGVQ